MRGGALGPPGAVVSSLDMADSEQEFGSHVVGQSLPWGPVDGSVAR